jgi:hypothetical protein
MEPAQLLNSTRFSRCACCAVMLAAIEQFGKAAWSLLPSWDLADRVVRIYAYGLSRDRDTLSLELYLKDGGPKRTLELFFPESATSQFTNSNELGAIEVHDRLTIIRPRIHRTACRESPAVAVEPPHVPGRPPMGSHAAADLLGTARRMPGQRRSRASQAGSGVS